MFPHESTVLAKLEGGMKPRKEEAMHRERVLPRAQWWRHLVILRAVASWLVHRWPVLLWGSRVSPPAQPHQVCSFTLSTISP